METIKGWALKNKETQNILSSFYPSKEYAENMNGNDLRYEPVEITITYNKETA